MVKLFFTLIFLLFAIVQLNAQQIPQKVQRSTWVKIMSNDSAYNYLEAQKEFQNFYKEYLNEKKRELKRQQRNKTASEAEVHLESPTELLVADFLKWTIMIKPFVRADGSILPLKERLAIINEYKRN